MTSEKAGLLPGLHLPRGGENQNWVPGGSVEKLWEVREALRTEVLLSPNWRFFRAQVTSHPD